MRVNGERSYVSNDESSGCEAVQEHGGFIESSFLQSSNELHAVSLDMIAALNGFWSR